MSDVSLQDETLVCVDCSAPLKGRGATILTELLATEIAARLAQN